MGLITLSFLFILSRAELGACPCPVSRGADIFVLISPSLSSPPLQLSTSHEDRTQLWTQRTLTVMSYCLELETNLRKIWSFTITETALVLFVKSSLRFVSSPSQESSQCWIVNIGARQESLQCAPSVCSLKASSLFSLSISATHNSHESSGGQNIKFHLNHLWNNHNRLRWTKIIILRTAMCRYIFWCNLKDPI